MIKLIDKQEIIISYFRDGKSQRQIEKETGISRKTIRKYIKRYENARNQLIDNKKSDIDVEELIDEIVQVPKYDSSNRKKKKLTDEVIEKIEFYLKENKMKKEMGMAKQQKKAIDIYECLKEEGYDIGYSTVCSKVKELKNKKKEAFIRQEYSPGYICEFDWGEVRLIIGEKVKIAQMAVFTTARGNYRYAKLYYNQKTECFLDSHAEFFEHVGGVYHTMVYDNMKVAVKRFIGRTEKEPTDELLKMSLYYQFKIRFCNARSGNEKGHVEKSVDFVRGKAFSKRIEFDTLEEANIYLMEELIKINSRPQAMYQKKSSVELLNEEKPYLLPRILKYDVAITKELRVDKYSTISIDECRYSVPDSLVGEFVFTKIYPDRVVCYYQMKKVAEHKRKYGSHEWSIKIEHYLDTIKKKPGALKGSTALKQAEPELQIIYQKYYIKKERDFIDLIEISLDKGLDKVIEAIIKLEKISPLDITTDKIKLLITRQECNEDNNKNTTDEIANCSKEILNIYGSFLHENNESFSKEAQII